MTTLREAYDLIDRFLRNNLYDDDYAEYSEALELLSSEPPQRKPLTDQQKLDLVTNWFAEDWAIKKALGLLHDYDIERAHGIGEQK